MANPYDAYQQMAETLKEAGTDLSGGKTYSEKDNQSSAPDTSPRPRARPVFMDDDDDDNKNTLTFTKEDSGESDSISLSNADLESPLRDTTGDFIGKVNLKDGTLDFKKEFVDLYSGGLYDEGLKILPGVKYGDTVTGNKGIKFKTGVGEIHADLDIDAYDAVMRGDDVRGEANLNFVFRPQSIFTNRAKGGSTSDKTPVQMEMDLILSETKDPVSGNTAPLGATPEEVRDDIPINASPNEFVINAATRRYYGTKFFEELQKSAAEGWKRIKDGKESYFRDDELDVEDDEKGQDKPINMQEGGVVPQPTGGGFGSYGGAGPMFTGFESRRFVNDETGQEIIIFFFNGRPMSRIPEGFREKGETPVEEQVQQEDTDDIDDPVITGQDSWRNKNPSNYTLDDYKAYANFYKSKGDNPLKMSALEKGILSIAGDSLLGRLLGSGGGDALIKKTQEGIVKKAGLINDSINKILKSGIDNQGNKINDDDNNTLFQAQYNANLISATADPMGQTTGTPIFDQAFYQDDDGGFNFEALLPPSGSSDTPINITPEEQAAADAIMERSLYSGPSKSPYSGSTSSQTFSEAFADAREEQGAGGTFEYQGSTYTTDYADED